MVFLGVDGGGTKTDFLLIDESGSVDPELTRATEDHYRGSLTAGRHQSIDQMMLVNHSVPVATGSVIRTNAIDWVCLPGAAKRVAATSKLQIKNCLTSNS